MGRFRKDDARKTIEEYGKTPEEYRAEERARFTGFLKTGVFVLASSVALLILSFSWFASNRSVTGTGMRVSVNDGRRFYLATRAEDQQGVYDDNTRQNSSLAQALNKLYRTDSEEEINYDISYQGLPQFDVGTTRVTGSDNREYIVGDADGISLMVNSTSNLNNNMKYGIGPGSRGEVSFYIIPTVAGPNKAGFTVYLSAYKLAFSEATTDNKVSARAERIDGSTENLMLRNFLCGHVLLFAGKDGSGNYAGQLNPELGEDGSISFLLEKEWDNWTINQPVRITLYWVWPYRFENMVYAGQRESVFRTSGPAQDELISWINGNRDYIVGGEEAETLEDVSTGMSNSGLSQWSAGYNRGDQLIGDTVAYFTWAIAAEY